MVAVHILTLLPTCLHEKGRRVAMPIRPYEEFAPVYDQTMGALSVRRYAKFIDRVLAELGKRPLEILDLACGAGHLAAHLVKNGHSVTGVDHSEAMLALARENAPSAQFELFDMSAPHALGRKFDVIVCLFDSINHLTELQIVTRLFEHLRKTLVPRGMLLFDVNTEVGFASRWRGTFVDIRDDVVIVGRPTWNESDSRGVFALTWFRKVAGAANRWTRHSTEIPEAAYSNKELAGALVQSGFSSTQVISTTQDPDLPNEEGRDFWIARL